MSEPSPPPRRPYTRPQLQHHGPLAGLTRVTGGTSGMNDTYKMRNKTGL